MDVERAALPLVYSCSGCSGAAQMANALALRLDREGLAEMSCVAGIGGGVQALLRRARQPRVRVTLDGCALACARACLVRENIDVSLSIDFASHGVKKRPGGTFDDSDAEKLWREVLVPALVALKLRNSEIVTLHSPSHNYGDPHELEPR